MHLIFINYLLIFNILYLCIDDYLKKYPPLDTSSAPLNQLSVISYQLSVSQAYGGGCAHRHQRIKVLLVGDARPLVFN
ncbi:hypothetical protein NIES4073_76620 [Kalymmatonema gypsitolerans NIES-4073]|nr:hypothetical protein NIES4073_76620 [Scytonema sp. NIES-4073]